MINREIAIMMYARHPTIVKIIGYSKLDFQEENNITIIMELAKNGSLKNVIQNIQKGNGHKNYTNTSRQIILAGVARGMKYLHDRNIIHRDLKTDNILLDEDLYPHITDFGLSKFIEVGHTRSQSKFAGTLQYEAPEILQGFKYDQKVDVYSFAIVIFEVLTDSVPYPEIEKEEFNAFKFIKDVIEKNYRPKFTVPIKESFKKLIEKCWSKNPEERPSFGEIFTILSDNNHQEENFMLDDVDVDEFNLYIENITDVTDVTEKLLNKISKIETENKNLKSEIIRKNDIIEKFKNEIDTQRRDQKLSSHIREIFPNDQDEAILAYIRKDFDFASSIRGIYASGDDDYIKENIKDSYTNQLKNKVQQIEKINGQLNALQQENNQKDYMISISKDDYDVLQHRLQDFINRIIQLNQENEKLKRQNKDYILYNEATLLQLKQENEEMLNFACKCREVLPGDNDEAKLNNARLNTNLAEEVRRKLLNNGESGNPSIDERLLNKIDDLIKGH